MNLLLLIYFTYLGTAAAIIPGPADRIVGGSDARAGQFGAAAAINVQTASSRFFCTGGLTSNIWAITSGTCVNGGVLFTIQVASTALNDTSVTVVATSEYVIHPDFDANTLKADIGLIKLRMPLEFNWYLSFVYTYWMAPPEGSSVVAIGWGQTSDSNSNLSNDLKYVNLTVISNEACRTYYGNQIREEMLCVVGNQNEGICIGDTGGPLTYYGGWWLLGIASFLSGNGCETVEPSGFTTIAPYRYWIDSYINSSYAGSSK